jgi:hypothetical protein
MDAWRVGQQELDALDAAVRQAQRSLDKPAQHSSQDIHVGAQMMSGSLPHEAAVAPATASVQFATPGLWAAQTNELEPGKAVH